MGASAGCSTTGVFGFFIGYLYLKNQIYEIDRSKLPRGPQ